MASSPGPGTVLGGLLLWFCLLCLPGAGAQAGLRVGPTATATRAVRMTVTRTARPIATPTPTRLPPATLSPQAAPLAADLLAILQAGLEPTRTPSVRQAGFQGLVDVFVMPLKLAPGYTPLWAAYSLGERWYDPLQHHFVGLYARKNERWQELSRLELSEPDVIEPGALRQVFIEPTHAWFVLQSRAGAHGACFHLLNFDGSRLQETLAHCANQAPAGELRDLNGDGIPEVLLDRSELYIFCYLCNVRRVDYEIWHWERTRFVALRLSAPPATLDVARARTFRRAVELAQAGLWKEARAALPPPAAVFKTEDLAAWNTVWIDWIATQRQQSIAFSEYPLLEQVFYGDYEAAVKPFLAFKPEQVFDPQSAWIQGTPAEGRLQTLWEQLDEATSRAVRARPDLAAAYFLRAWGRFLIAPTDPQVLRDLERAVQADSSQTFYSTCLEYVRLARLPKCTETPEPKEKK